MPVLRLKPSYQIKISGPATISIDRVWGKVVTLNVECAKDVNVKWGSRRKFGQKNAVINVKKVTDDSDER